MGTPAKGGSRSSTAKNFPCLEGRLPNAVTVKNETAMLTTFNEVNMKPIFDLRKEFKEDFKAAWRWSWVYELFTKACVRATNVS